MEGAGHSAVSHQMVPQQTYTLPPTSVAQPPPPPPPLTPQQQQGFQSPPGDQSSQGQVGQFDAAQSQPNFGDGSELQSNQQENEGELLNVQVPSPLPDKTVDSVEELQMEQKFRDVLQFIADRADVNLSTPVRHLGDTRVHLLSEQFTPKSEFVALTTTEALQQLVVAWWGEFKRRDITST